MSETAGEPAAVPLWRTSSYTYGGGNCVEAAPLGGRVAVRDSKQPDGTRLAFTPAAWREFTANVRRLR